MTIGISAPITPSPSGPSVGEMARQAATLVGLPEHPEALEEAKQGINRGIRELNTRVWNFTRKQNDFTLFANIKTDFPFKAPTGGRIYSPKFTTPKVPVPRLVEWELSKTTVEERLERVEKLLEKLLKSKEKKR